MKLWKQVLTTVAARDAAIDAIDDMVRNELKLYFDVIFGERWSSGDVVSCDESHVVLKAYVSGRFGGDYDSVEIPTSYLELDIGTFREEWSKLCTERQASIKAWEQQEQEQSDLRELKRLKDKYEPSEGVS